jgi:sortase A
MSDDTLVAEPPAPPPAEKPSMSTGDKVRFVLRGVGQTLITLGLVVLLFVVYEVWVTNIFARNENDKVASKLERVWEDPNVVTLPGGGAGTIALGTGVANIYIPRFGPDYHWTIVEGTGQDELEKGPGHYVNTAGPGEVGNFGVAGHRVGKGEPFLNLDKLRVGDTVIVETKAKWFVYDVLGAQPGSSPRDSDSAVKVAGGGTVQVPGQEIVPPSAGRVLLPVPNDDGAKPVARLMTLTTCHPKFTAEKRMIVHATLVDQDTALVNGKHSNTMPAKIKALYSGVS